MNNKRIQNIIQIQSELLESCSQRQRLEISIERCKLTEDFKTKELRIALMSYINKYESYKDNRKELEKVFNQLIYTWEKIKDEYK